MRSTAKNVGVPMAEGARTIVYFCYGSSEIYHQTLFSILSLLYVQPEVHNRVRIVVYCDNPSCFQSLPVETIETTQSRLNEWLGRSDYIHRRKTFVLIDAVTRFGGRVLFVDSDTYWLCSSGKLFDRIGPDRVCFHICEGLLLSTGTPFDEALALQLQSSSYALQWGQPVSVTPTTPMWNTGVVGIDASHLEHVWTALVLSDEIWRRADPEGPYGRKIHHAEQFAMGYVFKDFRISEACDCVYHYWPVEAKAAFAPVLAQCLGVTLPGLPQIDLSNLYARRYREGRRSAWPNRLKMLVRKMALDRGIAVKGVRRSV